MYFQLLPSVHLPSDLCSVTLLHPNTADVTMRKCFDIKACKHSVGFPTKCQCKLVHYEHHFQETELTLTCCASVTLCVCISNSLVSHKMERVSPVL